MMRASFVGLLVVLVATSACSRGAIAPDPADDRPLPPPDGLGLGPSQAEQTTPALGASCAPGPTCNARGRVSIRHYFQLDDRAKSGSCTPAPLAKVGNVVYESACVGNGRLVYVSSCTDCRLPSATVVEAEIAELSPQQLSNLQHHLRFEGPLRTAAAWEAALARGVRARQGT